MISLFQSGGLIMWVLLLASVITLAIILERSFFFFQLRLKREQLLKELRSILTRFPSTATLAAARAHCTRLEKKNPLALLSEKLLQHQERDRATLEKLALVEMQKQTTVFEKRLSALSSIAAISPLLGLLGTVLGMIRSFLSLSGGTMEGVFLANGISQALVTTAFGLVVAIPAVFFYNFFTARVNFMLTQLEVGSAELLDFLKGGGRDE